MAVVCVVNGWRVLEGPGYFFGRLVFALDYDFAGWVRFFGGGVLGAASF